MLWLQISFKNRWLNFYITATDKNSDPVQSMQPEENLFFCKHSQPSRHPAAYLWMIIALERLTLTSAYRIEQKNYIYRYVSSLDLFLCIWLHGKYLWVGARIKRWDGYAGGWGDTGDKNEEGGLSSTCGLRQASTNHIGTWQSEWHMNNGSILQTPVNRPIHHRGGGGED